ncbi:winged helix-turn-helix transcriptional regulator [Ktedonobacter robiniae]|uniref:winged helix-turn-helix transcriptional regulator n=1 Tax=Ktedonobacter robiniae TaxID=2778365 RepID=UPI00191606F9|nr:helix-turn-helix domain-containing protein [Ktedonobacter robiniae]
MTRVKKTAACPIGGVGVGGKWMFWIWYHLLSGTKRFGELQRLIPGASRQMLTQELRELEQVGVLRRKVYVQVPPKVEYSLTELGWQAEPVVRQLEAWGRWYGEQVHLEFDWMVSLGGKWTFWLWYHLLSGPKRFSELQKLLPEISRQVLTLELRKLEQMGVLYRQASSGEETKGAYALTELGRNSEPILRQFYAWGRWICEQLDLDYDWPVLDEPVVRAS